MSVGSKMISMPLGH